MKCWHRNSAPSAVVSGEAQGYVKEPVSDKGEIDLILPHVIPRHCSKRMSALRSQGDEECYSNVYPVLDSKSLICVTKQPIQACKPECNVQDTERLQVCYRFCLQA